MRQTTAVSVELLVEGSCADDDGQERPFEGRVIALATESDGPAPSATSTWLLIADDRRAAPIWVRQTDITGHRLGR
jgi:hypothetical protein